MMHNANHTPLIDNARTMRRALTPAEATLWKILRTPPLDMWHFRRQVVFPPLYIADFASHAAKIVIEADGASHDFTAEADEGRTDWLGERGYRVVRFANAKILQDSQSVWRAICAQMPEGQPPPRSRKSASRPPRRGGGINGDPD